MKRGKGKKGEKRGKKKKKWESKEKGEEWNEQRNRGYSKRKRRIGEIREGIGRGKR